MNEKHLAEMDKSKFLVPEELTMSQLVNIIRYVPQPIHNYCM